MDREAIRRLDALKDLIQQTGQDMGIIHIIKIVDTTTELHNKAQQAIKVRQQNPSMTLKPQPPPQT